MLCERAFAHLLDRGGMRRTWLRGRDNVAKRSLVQVAGYNLGPADARPVRRRHPRADIGIDGDFGENGAEGVHCIAAPHVGIGLRRLALMERTVLDPRDGRPVNAHMADDLVLVNLDIPHLEAHFVEEGDPQVNPLGVKGLGEIALVGMAPAIANVCSMPGVSACTLPIRSEDVLTA